MKRILIYITAILIVSCTSSKDTVKTPDTPIAPATSKLDRSVVPGPGPAPEIKVGEYQSFQLDNGLKVYVVENNKLPRVAFSLRVDRDPIFEGDKAGYTTIVGDLLSRGTASKTKADINEATDFIGASLSTSSRGIYGSSLTKHKDGLLSVMQDVLMNPSFSQEELDKIKKLELSNLVSNRDEPSVIITNIRGLAVYGKDHPYGEMISEKSIGNITREDCVNYFNTYWSPKKAYMAIVGDITLADAKVLANKYFGSWKGGDIPSHKYEQPKQPEQTTVVLVDRPQSVQSEIRVSYPVDLKLGDQDFFAATLLNQILGGGFSSRLMQNLREDKAYTYGAGSGFSNDRWIGRFSAGGSFRNEVTDSAVHEIMYELENIAANGITDGELKAAKAYLTGSFARSLESPQTIAGFAINTALNNLPHNYYADYLKKLETVTIADVNASAKKFIKPDNAYIVVVGKASEIGDKLKRFGPIVYYDADGNAYDPSKNDATILGMKPQTVIDNYIKALGGADKLKAVINVKKDWTLTMQGQELKIEEVKKADGKFRQDILMGGQSVQQVICDGKNVVTIAQGQQQPMDDESKMSEIISNRLFPELYYMQYGVKLDLKGVERVDGEDAYHIVVIYASGSESDVYFSAKTGLKLKEGSVVNSPMGELTKSTSFSNYKLVDGVSYAHSESTSVGPQKYSVTLNSVEINTKISDDLFKVGK